MPRGGKRLGAGRPKGSTGARMVARRKIGRYIDDVDTPLGDNAMPLDYMLAVMRNPHTRKDRRDRMAIAAAPYVHAKIAAELSLAGGVLPLRLDQLTDTQLAAIITRLRAGLGLAARNSTEPPITDVEGSIRTVSH